MSMYSGIGSFAKKYSNGGELNVTDPSSGGGANNEAFKRWKASFTAEQLQAMMDNPADLTLYQIFTLNPLTGGSGSSAGTSGSTAGTKPLPDYMVINDANQISFVEGVTNRQFVEGLNLLGLLDTQHSEGLTDYQWLLKWFDDTGGGGGKGTWLNVHLSNPDRVLDFDKMYGSDSDLTSENQATLRRLNDLVNNASAAGGAFTASPSFLTEYGALSVNADTGGTGGTGGTGDTGDTGGTGESTYTPRPLTIGPRPTGGVEGSAYYSLSDVFVPSSQQVNLYDRFDPYPAGNFRYYKNKNNPYVTPVTTNYGYSSPATDANTGTTSGTDLVFDTEDADVVDSTVEDADVVTTTQGTGGTGITVDESAILGDTTTSTTTAPANTSTTSTVNTTTAPTGPLTGYHGYSAFREEDPYLFGKRSTSSGINFLAGSREDLTAQDFQALLSGQQGAYGEGLSYDPKFGIYSNISDSELQRLREQNPHADFMGIDPRRLTDLERVRSNLFRSVGGARGRSIYDDDGNVYKRGLSAMRIGDKQYFMNEDGTFTSYGVQDVNYGYSPSFNNTRAEAGFAEGGIVSIAGDIADMQTTGEGIESFLNPERSKATLRRNLAKLAPRPTVPVMQQGIMPMAQ